ncbi:ATPase protein [Trypanosoma cruzi Dm28c]|uniref:ATPase protein n=1 Tax=Trypanosoma cruzi Dm28c TaxID=1416333 RepID=V5BAN2_TRYCR|nr:ATPase protein [Trypanosoma cruzi Dm28c]
MEGGAVVLLLFYLVAVALLLDYFSFLVPSLWQEVDMGERKANGVVFVSLNLHECFALRREILFFFFFVCICSVSVCFFSCFFSFSFSLWLSMRVRAASRPVARNTLPSRKGTHRGKEGGSHFCCFIIYCYFGFVGFKRNTRDLFFFFAVFLFYFIFYSFCFTSLSFDANGFMEGVSVVPVEVRCRPPRVNRTELSKVITSFIRQRHAFIHPGEILSLDTASDLIASTVELLRVCDVYCPQLGIPAEEADYAMVMYTLYTDESCGDSLNSVGLDEDAGAGLAPCSVLSLPSVSLEGLWETLFYGETRSDSVRLKRDLLQYMRTAMVFSRAGVDPHIVAWNRLILLYGPPGTGKTSLCKALAQKLSIRLNDMFPFAQLVEINAHSLFSRWFSESGKQVMLLFKQIHEIADKPNSLLCVLLDEVESLAATRQSALRGNEPSDAIRVVNALLTQLDSLQRRHNVVVFATSNITGAIDVAFIDRADKKIFIGAPGFQARLELLKSSTQEMIRRGLVILEASSCGEFINEETWPPVVSRDMELGQSELLQLEAIARQCEAFSGRTLKKLPFLAYSEYAMGGCGVASHFISFSTFMNGLQMAVRAEVSAREAMMSS